MNYTHEDLLKAAHSLQINGDFVTVTYHGMFSGYIEVVTLQGLEIHLYLDHDWVDGIATVLWTCGDQYSDGVIVESHHQVISDLSAMIHQLHRAA